MSNQEKLINWWWSPNGPCEKGPISVRKIGILLGKARNDNVVKGRQGSSVSQAGWNYAVLKFIIEYCTLSSEVKQKLVAFANPRSGNYARWQDFNDYSAEIMRISAADHVPNSSAQAQAYGPSIISPVEKLPDDDGKVLLSYLIADLQGAIANGGIDSEVLKQAMHVLLALGYQYDHDLFPDLVGEGGTPLSC